MLPEIGLLVLEVGVFVSHFDQGSSVRLRGLAADVEHADSLLDIVFILFLEPFALDLNLLLDEIVGLDLQERMDFFGDLLTLLLLVDGSLVLGLDQEQIFLKLLAPFLLLFHAQLLLLDLQIDLLFLGEATNSQMSTFAPSLKMGRNVLEEGI